MQLNKIHPAFFIFLSALALMWAALYNGFPLVYSDTGTYLESGFTLETPLDRPITYGILLRIFSLNGLTLWSVPFFQSAILSLVLYWTVSAMIGELYARKGFLILIAVLSACSGLSIVCSELIADIFTSVCVLSLVLLLFFTHSQTKTIALYTILTVSCACHISHVMIAFGIVGGVLLFRAIRSWRTKSAVSGKRTIIISSILILFAFTIMMSSVSKSRHVFMMGHLAETGILQVYLDENCSKTSWSLCAHREEIPSNAEAFIWNLDSNNVLNNTGGWIGSKEEYSQIISATFSDSRYLKLHARASLSGTLRQLLQVYVGEGLGKYNSAQLASQRIAKYFPGEYDAYIRSKQSADEFASLPVIDRVNKIALVLSLVVMIASLMIVRSRQLKLLGLVVISAYLLNCIVCATLAVVASRFGARLAWLFILYAVLAILFYTFNRSGRHTEVISK